MKPLFRRAFDSLFVSTLSRRIARGAFWSTAGSIVSRGLGLLAWILVGRILGKTGFGELGSLQATLGFFGTLATFGIGIAATKFVAEYRATDPDRAGRVIALGSLIAWCFGALLTIALLLVSDWMSVEVLRAPHLREAVLASAGQLLFGAVAGAQTGALAGFEAFRLVYRVNLAIGLTTFPVLVGTAYFGGVTGAAWALTGMAALGCALNWVALRHLCRKERIRVPFARAWEERSMLLTFNLPAVLNGVMSAAGVLICTALLARQARGFDELGLYNAALRIKMVPETLLTMLVAPMIPILSASFAQSKEGEFGRALALGFRISLIVVVPISLLQIAAPWLSFLPFGAQFQGGEQVAQWLMVSAIVSSLAWPIGMIFISTGRVWLALAISTFQLICFVGLAYYLIPTQGATGYAVAYTTALVTANVPCLFLMYREFRQTMNEIQWMTIAGVSVALVLTGLVASSLLQQRMLSLLAGMGLAALFAFLAVRRFGKNINIASK
jgi:O-antigen/teichoic acid export membrane protein